MYGFAVQQRVSAHLSLPLGIKGRWHGEAVTEGITSANARCYEFASAPWYLIRTYRWIPSVSLRLTAPLDAKGSLWGAQSQSLPLEGKVPPQGAKEEETESF